MAGSGRAHTVNGPVTVTFTANPKQPSSFKTVNGNVDVSFLDGLAADFAMKTFNGGLFTDFDAQPLASTRRGRRRTPQRALRLSRQRIHARARRQRRAGDHFRNAEWQRSRSSSGRDSTMTIRQFIRGSIVLLGLRVGGVHVRGAGDSSPRSMPAATQPAAVGRSGHGAVERSVAPRPDRRVAGAGQHHGARHQSQGRARDRAPGDAIGRAAAPIRTPPACAAFRRPRASASPKTPIASRSRPTVRTVRSRSRSRRRRAPT